MHKQEKGESNSLHRGPAGPGNPSRGDGIPFKNLRNQTSPQEGLH
jgi:hypothetical protein